MGYTQNKAEFQINKDNQVFIVFGDHTRSFNIATNSFCVMDNVKVLALKDKLSIQILQFITSSWKKCIPNKGYSRHWSYAKNVLFSLPIIENHNPDFDFMEQFIAQLESERLQKLDAYLSATGLKNYQLTEAEQQALLCYEDKIFNEFKVIDIFTVRNTGNILSRDIVKNSGDTPYLCASGENNGVSSYISYDESHIDHRNCVFIGGKTFVVSYQENDFYSNDSHNLVLYLKEGSKNKFNQLGLVGCINKSLKHKYSWGG